MLSTSSDRYEPKAKLTQDNGEQITWHSVFTATEKDKDLALGPQRWEDDQAALHVLQLLKSIEVSPRTEDVDALQSKASDPRTSNTVLSTDSS